ncbi:MULTISPECIES: class II aldolase/adducin family protein [Streptomyces]|uniref:Class II aldolase/adducin N-terminal domain-containing protein n=1 Tax=Streptomyces xinghaiensis TaxID=1038928 RepID=A0A3R7HIW8_9ACTN|nr:MULTISPECIES: class II aldolase/adducin family protein [Streptomyces]OFA46733.1 hypothetical protein BEN35_20825 [Streptomyces fradiae]PQM22298.1 hypothetical protein Sfr7A_15100 [Streptomyces xinghaiensis]RKM96733.1 hypothetical protein SFRA_012005 [Streptomyces xinghaiensis]RNC74115.1 hypothetical protein DC095_010140 [Streptomyces xinghaiensis]
MKAVYFREDAELQREHLSAVCRSLYRRGWMPGTSGSISVRSGEAVLITACDLRKGMMDGRDTVLVDHLTGLPLLGEVEWPPPETPVHLAIYGRLPDCGAVVHAQAPSCSALGDLAGGAGEVVLPEPEEVQSHAAPVPGPAVLPVLENRTDASRAAGEVTAVLGDWTADPPHALLVERGGVFAWGRDTGEALARLERVEELGHLLLLSGVGGLGAAKADAR